MLLTRCCFHRRISLSAAIEMNTDLTNRSDIEMLVRKFYDKVKHDPLLAPHFSHVDWATHLPVMYNFWTSMMLGEQSYRGNPFQKHVNLIIDADHFHAWEKLFYETVDEHFSGEKANEIKVRARNISKVFQYKMNLSPNDQQHSAQ